MSLWHFVHFYETVPQWHHWFYNILSLSEPLWAFLSLFEPFSASLSHSKPYWLFFVSLVLTETLWPSLCLSEPLCVSLTLCLSDSLCVSDTLCVSGHFLTPRLSDCLSLIHVFQLQFHCLEGGAFFYRPNLVVWWPTFRCSTWTGPKWLWIPTLWYLSLVTD